MITIFFSKNDFLQNPIIFSELFKLEQKFTTNTIQTVSIVKEASFLAAKSEHFCEKAVISNKYQRAHNIKMKSNQSKQITIQD